MSHRFRHAVHVLLGLLATAALALSAAAPAGARIPPDHQNGTRIVVRHATAGGPLWTYVVVAAVALLVGAAASWAIGRIRVDARPARTLTA